MWVSGRSGVRLNSVRRQREIEWFPHSAPRDTEVLPRGRGCFGHHWHRIRVVAKEGVDSQDAAVRDHGRILTGDPRLVTFRSVGPPHEAASGMRDRRSHGGKVVTGSLLVKCLDGPI